jgi:hypothetical protein
VSSALQVAQHSASRLEEIEDMMARERDDYEAAREHESHIRERELDRMAAKIKAEVNDNISVSINSAMKANTAAVQEAITTSVNSALSQAGVNPGNALGRDHFEYQPDYASLVEEQLSPTGDIFGNSLQKQQAYQDVTGLLPKPQQTPYQPREGGYQPREGGYQPREGGYQSREGGYPPREGGFRPREGGYQGGYQPRYNNGYQQNNGFQQNRGIPYPSRGFHPASPHGSLQPLAYTPPEYCSTCGQTHTACSAIGPKTDDSGEKAHCFLREVETNGRVNLDVIKLDKLKLAQLPTQQFEAVISAAAKFGCLSNLAKEALDTYKHQFANHRDAIKESVGVSRGSV